MNMDARRTAAQFGQRSVGWGGREHDRDRQTAQEMQWSNSIAKGFSNFCIHKTERADTNDRGETNAVDRRGRMTCICLSRHCHVAADKSC